MEVHAPHEPILTLREFMVHLLVVTVGILVALGLEQSVEAFHHHQLAAEARENMLSEIADNKKELEAHLAKMGSVAKDRRDAIATINQLLAHKHLRDITLQLGFSRSTLQNASWTTASTVGALAYMDYREVKRFAEVYKLQDLFDRLQTDEIKEVSVGAGLLNALDQGPEKVSDDELRAIKHQLQQGLASLTVLGQVGGQLDEQYKRVVH